MHRTGFAINTGGRQGRWLVRRS